MDTIPKSAMAPEASPGQQSRGVGVRRVNNRPLYIIGGSMAVFLVIMASVAADRAQKQDRPATKAPEKGGSTAMFAKEIAGDRKDGIIQPATPPVVPALSEPVDLHRTALAIAKPDNPDIPPAPPTSAQDPRLPQNLSPRGDEVESLRKVKLQQLDEAVRARSGLQLAGPRGAPIGSAAGAGAAPAVPSRDDVLAKLVAVRQQIGEATQGDPGAAYSARYQQLLQGNAAGQGGGPGGLQSGHAAPGRDDIAHFSGAGEGDRWRLDSQPQAPRTPYELRAGFVIPAILISGINSALPGQIMAQVSQDVFDTPRGKWKLIPQGSRLVGAYSSEVAYGQARVLVAWQRIVFPDGKAMDIGAMPGADSAGYAGFKDMVNNHYWRTFSSAFLMSAVTAGIATSQSENVGFGRPSFSSAMSEAVGQQLGQVTAQLIAKNLNIAPTLEIRPGYRFNVIVTKDLTFSKPYQAFDY